MTEQNNLDVHDFVILPGSTIRVQTEFGIRDFVIENPIAAKAMKHTVITVSEVNELGSTEIGVDD